MPTPLRSAALLLGALGLGAAGAGSVPPEPPPTLAETGLYADPATLRLAPSVLFYQPQYPLWTDGAAKARWIFLPPGSTIDVSDPDAWVFPVGAKLWKEFAFGGRRVETRFLWHATANDWVFATYVWNEAGTAAVLAPPDGVAGAAEIAPGLRHDVPGRLCLLRDCRRGERRGKYRVADR